MNAFCPFNYQGCFERCALYNDGCLIRQALKAYVTLNTPIVYEIEKDLKLRHRPDEWAGQMSISSQWGDR